jgi:hypothetical protein
VGVCAERVARGIGVGLLTWLPSSAEEGWPKAGVVLVKNALFRQHHPVCANNDASRILFDRAATPPRLRRGAAVSCLSDPAYRPLVTFITVILEAPDT